MLLWSPVTAMNFFTQNCPIQQLTSLNDSGCGSLWLWQNGFWWSFSWKVVCLSLPQSGSCTLVASIGKLGREGGGEKSGVKSVTFYRGGVRIISCESPGHSFISFASCSGSYMLGDFLSFFFYFFLLEILGASFLCPRLLRDRVLWVWPTYSAVSLGIGMNQQKRAAYKPFLNILDMSSKEKSLKEVFREAANHRILGLRKTQWGGIYFNFLPLGFQC